MALDIAGRSRVRVDRVWVGDALLRCKQTSHVGIDLTDLVRAIGTRRGYAIAACGSDAYEVIALVGGEDEQRVALIDAIACQACEELAERIIVRLERRNITGLPRTLAWSPSGRFVGL